VWVADLSGNREGATARLGRSSHLPCHAEGRTEECKGLPNPMSISGGDGDPLRYLHVTMHASMLSQCKEGLVQVEPDVESARDCIRGFRQMPACGQGLLEPVDCSAMR
jgi:hypothetical protein